MKKESRSQSKTMGTKALKMGIGVALVGVLASLTSVELPQPKVDPILLDHFTVKGARTE